MLAKAAVTGMGVIGGNRARQSLRLQTPLLDGKHAFGVMQRPGRQRDSSYIGAKLAKSPFPPNIAERTLRTCSLSGGQPSVVLQEAWRESQLADVDPRRIGLIIGGSNVQQRELAQIHEAYRESSCSCGQPTG